jgi:anion-transporting  ArsA/GET3 family ATPase
MDLRHFFTASRILIVAGKGGTGKSTVAAALALSAARAGLRTRLVDFEGPAVETPDHALLTRETVSPGRALSDYLDSHGLGFVSRRLATTGIVELVASTAPGIDDLLVLGKVKSLANSSDLDLVVVDGPASGHALDMLRAPTHLRRAVPGGPIGHQADEVIEMLADSSRCRTMIVTTPAVTPVHEALEAAHQLAGEFSVALAPVAVNMVDEAPPAIDDAMSLPTHLRDAWTWATTRAQSQASAVAELDTALASHLHVARMLLRRHRLDGVDLIEAMSDDLAAEIERLPESGAT